MDTAAGLAANVVAGAIKIPIGIALPVFVLCTFLATHRGYTLVRNKVLRRFPVDTFVSNLSPVENAIPRRFPRRLHGRKELIDSLSATEPGEIALLCGMAGVGKTAVAAAVAECYENAGRPVYWVSCLDPQAIAASMLGVAQAAGMPEDEAARHHGSGMLQSFDAVWRYINKQREEGGWLLVFDDADIPAALAAPGSSVADLTGWLRPSRYGIVIVTTRNRDPATWGMRVRIHELRALNPADGAQVLRDLAPDATTVDADVRALSTRLGNLPLALKIAGAYMARPVTRHRDAASYLTTMPDDPTKTLQHACQVTLRTLVRSGYPEAERVLWLLSILYHRPIPLDFVRLLASSPVRFAGIGRSADIFDSVLEQLHSFNLITVISTADRIVIELHPLIAETYRAEATRSLRCDRILRTILRGIAEQSSRRRILTADEARAVFTEVIFELLDPSRRRLRVVRELASATVELATSTAGDGDVALAYHYLALAQLATATVPHDNPAFPRQGQGQYRFSGPPTPRAAGLAWPAIWLAADRRYEEAIQFCDRILDLNRNPRSEMLRVRRFRLDVRFAQEGGPDTFDEYIHICVEEDAQLHDMNLINPDDLDYTIYLGGLVADRFGWDVIWNVIEYTNDIPEAARRRFAMVRTNRSHAPLYWRRRLRQGPAIGRNDPLNSNRRNLIGQRRMNGLGMLQRLGQLLPRYAEPRDTGQPASSLPSEYGRKARAENDPHWRLTQLVLRALQDPWGWTRTYHHDADWIALLDNYYWGSEDLAVVKLMASLQAESPPYPIVLSEVFNIGRSSLRHQTIFYLELLSILFYRETVSLSYQIAVPEIFRISKDYISFPPGILPVEIDDGTAPLFLETAPPTAPRPTKAAWERSRQDNPDAYNRAVRYILAVMDDERLWTYVDESAIGWDDILAVADEQQLSDSSKILLSIAASIWGGVSVSLNEAIRLLDDADFAAALHAIKILRGVTDW